MRTLFIILLGLSLSTIVQSANLPQPPAEKVVAHPSKEEAPPSNTICDPKEMSKMPETFY